MSEPKYREWILETIDSLRSRKARPDLERICRMVRRRYGSDPDRTRTELEKLIQEQTVLKVSYKGSISYRNAAKVQRKSRKKIDQPTGSGEAVVKQTKHTNFNNNGDRAHGPTETKETRTKDPVLTKANQCCDPQSKTLVITAQNDEAVLVSASGNSCLSCGAAVCTSQARCAAGSGGVQASVPKDKKLPQTGGSSNSTGGDKGISNNNGSGASGKTRGTRGVEAGLSGHEGSNDKEKKTCTIVNASNSHLLRQKQQTSFKPKLRVGAKGTSRGIADPNNLGDRLVASVRALAEKSRGTAAARGHTALGLKEILGFLSSQERLSQEKLTRSKVKVVLEREVERGRLRRTRFGNITLPVRGVGAPKPSARLLKSALQDRHISKKVKEMEPMDTDSGEEEEREGDMGAKECPNGGDSAPCLLAGKQEGLSAVEPHSTPSVDPVARPTEQAKLLLGSSFGNDITDPISGSTAKGRSPPPSSSCPAPQQEACSDKRCRSEVPPELHAGAGTVGGTRPQPLCPSAQRESEGGPEEASMEESVVTPEQLVPDSQDPVMLVTESKDIISTIHTQSCSGCKMESGVSSCLLTPTASPQELGVVEEQGLNGGVFVKMEKSGQNLVEWSVADVASYFIAAGFPEQAAAFRTQEIDGKSLLLMQRNDVLTGLSIRLGPALKIYERHVKVLQRTHFQEDGTLC